MDIEEMMVDYIMNNATQEETEEFSVMLVTEFAQEKNVKIILHRCQMKNLICL